MFFTYIYKIKEYTIYLLYCFILGQNFLVKVLDFQEFRILRGKKH